MVEKKLNFNQPIPSVRRHSLMTPPQKFDQTKTEDVLTPRGLRPHRSGLNSGPVRKPGSVPFQWERAPGQPKEQIMQQTRNENEGGDCDEAFVDDELDSLSRAKSFLSNSRISGLDDHDNDHPCRRFSMDEEQVKKEGGNQDKSTFRYRPTFAKSCSKEESENLTGICCLLPSSCIKSSVCILNSVPIMNVRTQLTMFQARGEHSGTLSTDSLSQVENQNEVKTFGKTDEAREKEADNNIGIALDTKHTFIEGFESRKSFKTLQDLLADEDSRKELDSTSCVEIANTVEKKLQRAKTLQNSFPVPPPLPRSPSDSWLFRTLPSMSTNKASTPTPMSRFSNKS